MTHGSFAVLDNQRNLPAILGRKKQDFSSWDVWVASTAYFPTTIQSAFHISMSSFRPTPYASKSVIEHLFLEPGELDVFRGLDHVAYTGGPLSSSIAEQIRQVSGIITFYGSTETACLPQLAPDPENWGWIEWNPYMKVQMEKTDDLEQTFELVVEVDERTKDFTGLYHNLAGIIRYPTGDLFSPHPTKPNLWRYYGRKDDIIVLSSASKFNPVPMEASLQESLLLAGALIVGQGRPQPTLMVEPNTNARVVRERILELIWPLVNEANRLVSGHGRIFRSKILVASLEKPFIRASKGTIVRGLTEQLYKMEIDSLYSRDLGADQKFDFSLKPSVENTFRIEDIAQFVRDIILESFLAAAEAGPHDDLLSHGLDSLQIVPRTIFQNSTIQGLTTAAYNYLTLKHVPSHDDNAVCSTRMQAMVARYTSGPIAKTSIPKQPLLFPKHIALIGYKRYFGSHLLPCFLDSPWIFKIYCMDTHLACPPPVATSHPNASKATFLPINFSLPNLSLDHILYKTLLDDIDVIIYNAWKPDLVNPLEAFEIPFIRGLRQVIDWSIASIRRPRIVFISSTCAVGDWATVKPNEIPSTETPLDNPAAALKMGYSEAKWGLWAEQEWLGSLVRASRAMGIIPEHVMAVDWVPVDQLAEVVREVVDVRDGGQEHGSRMFNLAHPEPKPWDILARTLRERFGMDLRTVSLLKWIRELERRGNEGDLEVVETGALGFLEAYRVFGNGRGFEWLPTEETTAAAASKVDLEPITIDLLEAWLRGWKL
ncbi:uncharacterized protein BDZ99DRAFT_576899 [Mytilinidion resinicola]|uniref:Thioester reductase (TE) domain-containing protein n=1 Tax=Mytilinidion resinicola TaxID=574789 RepID=A0A6A6Y425_9PEZI|nr:uncharacterized protein BDZ99DRAFT_576899 [Mytilinidion resinicola]KAF2802537.1 hypothetical protein BDZ99DRAFT_576899 [Mytilinidion resinicola]